jgi:hypothetical protein
MQVGVIGWWSYDNQGDLAMLASLHAGLSPHHVVPIDTGFPAYPDIIYRLNRLDYIILGGGTLIPGKPTAPFDTFDRWADQLEVPIGIAGLGVAPFPEQHWPAIEALLNRAQFFYVRDHESRNLLRDHPKVQVVPDLTFANPLLPRGDFVSDTKTAPVCGVNLRRSALGSLDPEPWLEVLKRLPVSIKGIPLSSFDVFDESALLKQLDPKSPECFDPSLYHHIELMIGTAFHAVLFAVQATVPVIAIGYAPKVCHFMADNGLAHYLLAPDEHYRLPALVNELLTHHSEIVAKLRTIREKLYQNAQRNIDSICKQIERSSPRHRETGPTVTIVIIGSGSDEKDQRTQASCASQTYRNVEILFVDADPQESVGARLQQVLRQSSGEYLTWVDGGDWFAEDAVDCLVSRLEEEPDRDVIYADYYTMSSTNLPVDYQTVPEIEKLYRRDVVGPCFLMRRTLLPLLDQVNVDAPLVAYGLWLRAKSTFIPFHAPLFYSGRSIKSRAFIAKERVTRRYWRRTQSLWKRIVWGIIDTDLGERLIVQPVVHILKWLRWGRYAEHR